MRRRGELDLDTDETYFRGIGVGKLLCGVTIEDLVGVWMLLVGSARGCACKVAAPVFASI